MATKRILLYIPWAREGNYGGQITAAKGIVHHLENCNTLFYLINTTPKGGAVYAEAARRVLQTKLHALKADVSSALFFKSSTLSLVERFMSACILSLRGTKCFLFFRNSELSFSHENKVLRILTKILLRPYKVVFVQGNCIKDSLVGLGVSPSRIVVIPNWLPPGFEFASPDNAVPSRYPVEFLFTGRFVKTKGVFDIIEAVGILAKTHSFRVKMVGNGPDLQEALISVRSRKLERFISFVGQADQMQINEYLTNAHVFILPTYHPEGTPNSIIEAMACGKPIISTNVGAIKESVMDAINGFIIEPRNPKMLAYRMKNYVESGELVRQHSFNSLKVARKRHSPKKNLDNLIKIIEHS